ncbi:hypothetical protein ACFCV8_00940 [Streptomyces sp. NPDC056347]|uniref:hypothetical protein n=1 Tax=Streptomyces sp. NPDC056347 TaxID=3345790 RepID=UPI0035DABC39
MSEQTTAQWLRAAGNRIATGSSRICLICARRAAKKATAKGRSAYDGIKDWLGESEGIAWLIKVAMLVGGGLVLRKVLLSLFTGLGALAQSDSWRWLLWPAGAAWLIAAYRIGHPDWKPPADPVDEQPASAEKEAPAEETPPTAEVPETPTEAPPADQPHPSITMTSSQVGRLLHDVYTEGSGVHLAALAERLDQAEFMGHPAARWATRDVRVLLTRHSIRIRPGVRVPPVGGREGVHKEDFLPLLSTAPGDPVVAVVAAGQSNNNNDNNNTSTTHREGVTITLTDDETNPARTHVHVQHLTT